jgi:hypothetical protein
MMLRQVKSYIVSILMIVNFSLDAKDDDSPIYTQYVAEVTSSFVKKMHKEYGLECGASGGEMPYDVEEISVSLVAYRSATVEEARELEIKTTERFVQIINAHEKIRPFLREYPFPSSRASVAISFEKPRKKTFAIDDNVLFVFQARNRIFYRAKNPDNPYVPKLIKDEPYEEALKIVQSDAAKNRIQRPEFL